MAARAQIYAHIEALEMTHIGSSPVAIAQDVDAIRKMASDHGFLVLADLSHGFSAWLAHHQKNGADLAEWIEALKDAAGCEALDRGVASAWLINLRHRVS